jgi:intein/homing endonuclease
MGFNGDTFQYTKVKDVIFSGNKEVFKVLLDTGESIKATSDHRFLTQLANKEECFIKLEELKEGDFVVTRYRNLKTPKKHKYRKEFCSKHLKYYPNATIKEINKRKYYRCLEQRVVYDA